MAEPTTWIALRDSARAYTAGTLPPSETVAFEARLAHDQGARDALVEAVQWQAGPDADELRPHPDYRREVVRRLTPHPFWAWVRSLAQPRGRAAWSLAGGALVVLLALGWQWSPGPVELPHNADSPALVEPRPVLVVQPRPAETLVQPQQNLSRDGHLVKVGEEARKLKPGMPEPESPLMP